jgi:hypothetical protein
VPAIISVSLSLQNREEELSTAAMSLANPLQKLLMLTLLEFRDGEIGAPTVSDCCL